jgi:F0F1-type ATP synthase epsilon subunit
MLNVTVRDREGIKFNGQAEVLSSVNGVGPFDILVGHANFISLIRKRVTIVESGGKKTEFNLQSGVIHVIKDKCLVFIN